MLFDVFQIETLHSVVLADGVYRLVDAFLQFAIENKEYLGGRVVAFEVVEQLGHRRAEVIELLCCPVAIDIFANGCSAP